MLCSFDDIKGNLLKALDISWKGLLAIFIVIAIIILLTVVLNWAVKKCPVLRANIKCSAEKAKLSRAAKKEKRAEKELSESTEKKTAENDDNNGL